MAGVVGTCFAVTAPKAQDQVVIGVGAAPICPYGYYDFAPYSCAPYGYYGPEWYADGVFIGAGPWFRGHAEFRGHVDNRYDVQHGYRGPMPNRGDRPEPARRPGTTANFKGNEVRDGRGHTGESGH
jgi:hypothetical protein